MDKEITDLIKQLHVRLAYSMDLDKPAHYISQIDTIVLNTRLNQREQEKALLHELGHVAKHKGLDLLYRKSFTMHAKMEAEADDFCVKRLLKKYLDNPEHDINQFNPCNFIEEEALDYRFESRVKTWFLEYCGLKEIAQ